MLFSYENIFGTNYISLLNIEKFILRNEVSLTFTFSAFGINPINLLALQYEKNLQ